MVCAQCTDLPEVHGRLDAIFVGMAQPLVSFPRKHNALNVLDNLFETAFCSPCYFIGLVLGHPVIRIRLSLGLLVPIVCLLALSECAHVGSFGFTSRAPHLQFPVQNTVLPETPRPSEPVVFLNKLRGMPGP